MEFFTKFLDKFEQFIRRAMMPSIVFFIIISAVFLIVIYIKKDFSSINSYKLFNTYINIDLTVGNLVLFFIVLIGISHILSILTQIIFDNNIKENYNAFFNFLNVKEDNNLEYLREKVIDKLSSENILKKVDNSNKELNSTDFMLYQIIGRKLQYFHKPTHTERYVDETKASGITFVSICLSILIIVTIYWNLVQAVLFSLIFLFIGYEHIKSKYRSRALRIYINYLIGEHK